MTFVCACITWPVLFPVNATGGNGKSQLEAISYSNIDIQDSTQRNRLYAHTFIGWIVYGFIMYMITRESIFYINLRQAFLLNPQYAQRISSRTVLFTCVPKDYLNEARIRQLFSGAVKHVWIAGNTKKLEEVVDERDEVAMKLEKAEVKLIKAVNKQRIKAAKKGGAEAETAPRDAETGNIASRYLPDKKRPHHRLGKFGLYGKKVDTINWGRSELQRLIPAAEAAQAEYTAGKYTQVSAVFVEFHNQSDAQAALQVTTHHHALQMSPRYIGVKPQDVVWKSLNIPWWQLVIRRYAVYAIIAALVIFWAIPVGIVGIIAQVNTLKKLPGLTWIGDIPQVSRFPGVSRFMSNSFSGHSRRRLWPAAFCCSGDPDVSCSCLHARPCQTRWLYQPGPGRALHPERLLLLPGRSSVLDPDTHQHSLDCCCSDRSKPYRGLRNPVNGPTNFV